MEKCKHSCRDGRRFYERTKFLRNSKIVVWRKKRTMDERFGSFREMEKKYRFLKTSKKRTI